MSKTTDLKRFFSFLGASLGLVWFGMFLVPDLQAQRVEHCNDCDGCYARPLAHGPLDGLRLLRRQLTCGGGGCGEVYFGEWISTPPDCYDPCCGDQFVGGAIPSRPFQWRPGMLLASLRFSGRLSGRFCSGDESSAPCGCDDCGSGHFFDSHDQVHSAVYHSTVLPSRYPAAVGGCSSCSEQAARPLMRTEPQYSVSQRGVTPHTARYASARYATARYTEARQAQAHHTDLRYDSRSVHANTRPPQHVDHRPHRLSQTYTASTGDRSAMPTTTADRHNSHSSHRTNLMREAANYGRIHPGSNYR